MKQVYAERRATDYGRGPDRAKELKVTAFETDKNDPELLPPLIHLYFKDRGETQPVDEWQIHDGLRGAEIIRKAILVFDEAAAVYFPSEEGVESH